MNILICCRTSFNTTSLIASLAQKDLPSFRFPLAKTTNFWLTNAFLKKIGWIIKVQMKLPLPRKLRLLFSWNFCANVCDSSLWVLICTFVRRWRIRLRGRYPATMYWQCLGESIITECKNTRFSSETQTHATFTKEKTLHSATLFHSGITIENRTSQKFPQGGGRKGRRLDENRSNRVELSQADKHRRRVRTIFCLE